MFLKKHGPYPIIIGGWAVYTYNSYSGSVDIDVVGPSMGGYFNNYLTQFQIANGYEEIHLGELGIEKGFQKAIYENGEKIGQMEIDACSYEADLKYFHENTGKILPYSLCDRATLQKVLVLPEGAEVIIPDKSLLVLYKIKALRDRKYDYENNRLISAARKTWLEGKITKDASDIIALLDPKPSSFLLEGQINPKTIREIVGEFDISFMLDSLDDLTSMKASLKKYRDVRKEDVAEWVHNIKRELI